MRSGAGEQCIAPAPMSTYQGRCAAHRSRKSTTTLTHHDNMNPPVTSDEPIPLPTQVNVTGEEPMTMAEVSQAWANFKPIYSNIIDNPVAGERPERFTTGDGRSGQFLSREEMGESVNILDWTANDDSEMGGYIDVWKRYDTHLLHPVKERIEFPFDGVKGFEVTKQRIFILGRPFVKTYVRPIRRSHGPTITADTYQKATLSAIPVLLDPQQDTMTYDPTRGGTTGRNTRAPTVAFTQEGITGKVAKTNFGSGTYKVGEGDQERSVSWCNFDVDGERLTRISTYYAHGVKKEIELSRGSRPELDGFEGKPNFTGRLLVSVNPENANVV